MSSYRFFRAKLAEQAVRCLIGARQGIATSTSFSAAVTPLWGLYWNLGNLESARSNIRSNYFWSKISVKWCKCALSLTLNWISTCCTIYRHRSVLEFMVFDNSADRCLARSLGDVMHGWNYHLPKPIFSGCPKHA